MGLVHRHKGDEVGLSIRLQSTRERRKYTVRASGPAGLVVVVARRIVRKLTGKLSGIVARRQDLARPTHSAIAPGELKSFLSGITAAPRSESYDVAARYYTEHRFDLLGSGWTKVFHGMRCRGIENVRYPAVPAPNIDAQGEWLKDRVNPANLDESQRIWRMVDEGYTAIDWHSDFKSGYRWNENTWYRDVRFLGIRGVDVKAPWELSRLQHFPQMAIQFGRTHDVAIPAEIRNQLLDWIACNPPKFGVNWYSTMDVAIRVANIVVAYDLAIAYGAVFDDRFKSVLRRSIYDHAVHIVSNLEWSADFRGNHYLSNIAGLLFAAAYLGEEVSETSAWVSFAAEELVTAVEEQFQEDGSNFEASTSYHRLSAEMVVYSVALLHRLGAATLPEWLLVCVQSMAEFTRWVTKPDRTIVQVGDNDSGRFLKIDTPYDSRSRAEAVTRYSTLDGFDELGPDAIWPDERHLDHSELQASISALFSVAASGGTTFAALFTSHLAGTPFKISAPSARAPFVPAYSAKSSSLGPPDAKHLVDCRYEGNLSARAFENFGLWVLRNEQVHLCIRCGSIGQNGIGGHAHNDQLSFELTADGKTIFADPGSYIYTPMPELRNAYRSANTHNGPKPAGQEPGALGIGLFRIVDAWKGECLGFSEAEFFGVMHRRSQRIYRRISVESTRVVVEDWAKGCSLDTSRKMLLAYSPGYGMLMKAEP